MWPLSTQALLRFGSPGENPLRTALTVIGWRIVVFLGVTLHGVVAWHRTNSPETPSETMQ
jgi:hypothetical protein